MHLKKIEVNSIRTKLVISLVLICIIPLIILGIVCYNKSKSILKKNLQLTSEQTLTEINNGLDFYFHIYSDKIELIANNYDFVNSAIAYENDKLGKLLNDITKSNKDILNTYYGTEDGKFIIYPEQKMPEGYNPKERGWYKLAVEHKGEVVITDPYEDASSGKTVISMAKTVEKDGKVIGVVSIDFSMDVIMGKIAKKNVGNNGYIFVVNQQGKIVVHPKSELIGTDEFAKLPVWKKVQLENNGFVEYIFKGVDKFGVFQINSMTGWKVVATLEKKELSNDTNAMLYILMLLIIMMCIIAIIISLVLSKGIHVNIQRLKEAFLKASNGDLKVTIESSTKDEFKELANSFNSMITNIAQLMDKVNKSSNQVLETSTNLADTFQQISASVGEVARTIEDVSVGATNQAQNSHSCVENMNVLSNELDKISLNSKEMDNVSISTKQLGSKGLEMVDSLTEKSNKTRIATTEVNNIVRDMNESTKQIGDISETISQITAQTNLLSLNASIEAARAGEAGKGFSVVADEIKKLAEKSSISTQEIKLIIENIQKKSNVAVEAIVSTENIVKEQDIAVVETQKIFSEILNSIETMINKVNEVKASINDINEKKQNAVEEIQNISFISEQAAASSEQVTASTEEIAATMDELTVYTDDLKYMAEQLSEEINKFEI